MKYVALDLTRIGVTCTHSRLEQFQNSGIACDEVVTRLSACFASETQSPQRVEWPADWWQHFKQRFFPAWLRARFPVRMQVREFSVKTVYPFLKTKLPLDVCGPRVLVLVNDVRAGVFLPECDGMTPGDYQAEVYKTQVEASFRSKHAAARTCPTCRRAWFEF